MRRQDRLNEVGLQGLAAAFLTMKTPREMQSFLVDLCSVRELNSLAQRLWVASLMEDGRTYAEIVETTGASTAIVSRISRMLASTDEGGMEKAVKRLKNQE